jgi:hypothetical protein
MFSAPPPQLFIAIFRCRPKLLAAFLSAGSTCFQGWAREIPLVGWREVQKAGRRRYSLFSVVGVQKPGQIWPVRCTLSLFVLCFAFTSERIVRRMSVIGIDLGNRNSIIAVAQRGGIDIVLNECSNRHTPYAHRPPFAPLVSSIAPGLVRGRDGHAICGSTNA